MHHLNLYELRENFNRSHIMLCFNGPIFHSLIEELGKALQHYLEADNAHPGAAMDVFATFIEMTQNIRHYATQHDYDEQVGSATVVVARDDEGHYVVQAGNLVGAGDGDALVARIDALAALDKAALKAAFKAQMRKPREPGSLSGAGLGILDMARKSVVPLQASASPAADGYQFFSLRAVI